MTRQLLSRFEFALTDGFALTGGVSAVGLVLVAKGVRFCVPEPSAPLGRELEAGASGKRDTVQFAQRSWAG